MEAGEILMLESPLQRKIRLLLGQKPDLVIWRNNTGTAREMNDFGEERFVHYGLVTGSSDIIGILSPSGRFFAMEVKAPGARTKPELKEKQRLFRELVIKMGGYACQVSSFEEAEAAYQRARQGLSAE